MKNDDLFGRTIESALQNWGRWALARGVQGHCASIEYRYRSKLRPDLTPTGWGDWIAYSAYIPPPPPPPVDALQALAVERMMRHLPDDHRKALKFAYVFRMPPDLICLRLAIRHEGWGRFLGDSQNMVANLLTRHTKYAIIRLQFDKPVKTETSAPVGAECV